MKSLLVSLSCGISNGHHYLHKYFSKSKFASDNGEWFELCITQVHKTHTTLCISLGTVRVHEWDVILFWDY